VIEETLGYIDGIERGTESLIGSLSSEILKLQLRIKVLEARLVDIPAGSEAEFLVRSNQRTRRYAVVAHDQAMDKVRDLSNRFVASEELSIRDRNELFERPILLLPQGFDVKALGLHGAEQLLDGPTLTIEVNDPASIRNIVHCVRGQQAPMSAINACRRIDLGCLDQAQRHSPR
jgi:hypothetical protein